ncbi:T9SS type A sorting domain-containing protein [Marixanthomonas ophiurae]|uniref:T9SS C-terminal target domain-containing protein n=1 Tax=Marixanthomonas ophiurae TaxID=387659 RepID=A0A3E1Q9Q2_9FLAO|nr:T9SS type A sorting domain-containing protein [Marixanthomonas ophiurae]RFN58858.1 T9SS C-terminal target domain-containing protein [Marixanthomonas ophiurae]
MKKLLLIYVLSISCFSISAQTKTWVGPSGGDFDVEAYWSPTGVPGGSNDVIIPTGSNMIFNTVATIRSFTLQGNAMATITNNSITTSEASSISANAVISWTTGEFRGTGTITNLGTINLVPGAALSQALREQVTLNNEGTINFNDTGLFKIGYGNPTLNNLPTGVLNLNSNTQIVGGNNQNGTIVNTGLIKRAQGTGVFEINTPLLNNNGTILVESGTLQITDENTVLTNGTYNISSNGILEWHSVPEPGITCEGTLSGQLDGPINWNWNLNIEAGTEAIFDFDGPGDVNWIQGKLKGDGTLTNLGVLHIVDGGQGTTIKDQMTLNNEGIINVEENSVFHIGDGNPILNNLPTGVLNLNSNGSIVDSNNQAGTIVNTGLINRVQGSGIFDISINVDNRAPGIINVETGTLKFEKTFVGDGILMGNGTVQLINGIAFEGRLSPGGHPGILTHFGDYTSTSDAIIAPEINGPNSGTEYDVFEIQGDAILNGDININMGYVANVNDEFVILTANNITSCNLPATVTASYNFMQHTFDVICNPDNIILKVNNIILGAEENTLSNLTLYPNPTDGNFTIDLGREYSGVTVQIYNILGQLIADERYASAKFIQKEINTSAGIYFIKVSIAKKGSSTLRIVKH